MTTDDAPLQVLMAPGDDLERLKYADWLDDNAGTAPCQACEKKPDEVNHPPGMMFVGWGHGWQPCSTCGGSATVADGRTEHAEFIRVQVALANCRDGRESCPPDSRCGRCMGCVLRERERELFVSGPTGGWGFPSAVDCTPFAEDYARGRGVGPVGLIRRGFVAEVRCTLEQFAGRACENCEGNGQFTQDNSDLPYGPCPDCGGGWDGYDEETGAPCWYAGSGRVGGIAAELFRAHPVERVVLTDVAVTPFVDGEGFRLYDFTLPPGILDLLQGGEVLTWTDGSRWRTYSGYQGQAADALSAACVAWGRDLAGLPPAIVG